MEECTPIPVLGKTRGTLRDVWNHLNRYVDVETKTTPIRLYFPEDKSGDCLILPEVESSPFRGIPADNYKPTIIEIGSSDEEENWEEFRKDCYSAMKRGSEKTNDVESNNTSNESGLDRNVTFEIDSGDKFVPIHNCQKEKKDFMNMVNNEMATINTGKSKEQMIKKDSDNKNMSVSADSIVELTKKTNESAEIPFDSSKKKKKKKNEMATIKTGKSKEQTIKKNSDNKKKMSVSADSIVELTKKTNESKEIPFDSSKKKKKKKKHYRDGCKNKTFVVDEKIKKNDKDNNSNQISSQDQISNVEHKSRKRDIQSGQINEGHKRLILKIPVKKLTRNILS